MATTLTRARAAVVGSAAIAALIALQGAIMVGCYKLDLVSLLGSAGLFLLPPLMPAMLALLCRNPLRAVGACVLVVPWVLWAWVVDCLLPYAGGGASLAQVTVLLGATPCAVLGVLLAGPVMRWLKVEVV